MGRHQCRHLPGPYKAACCLDDTGAGFAAVLLRVGNQTLPGHSRVRTPKCAVEYYCGLNALFQG